MGLTSELVLTMVVVSVGMTRGGEIDGGDLLEEMLWWFLARSR